ncbi:MAG: DUF2169 domain-containing protein [Planctomycetia bacterium]|nr:DUF2169 domain-containing protein [Planctomycetia bacterium]
MATLKNKSDFQGDLIPAQGSDGRILLIALIKGTFDIESAEEIAKSSKQEPICYADEYFGEEGKSSIRMGSDVAMRKPGTDVIMIGMVYAPNQQPVTKMLVTLQVGSVTKSVMIFGNRIWNRMLGSLYISKPEPFLKMPLKYEYAFGGVDTRHKNPAKHDWERRNPVGTGFYAQKPENGLPLPNIEDPHNLIKNWSDRPVPAGFGFIDRNWEQRAQYAGTYDEKWKNEQFPLLPEDFDDRAFQAAHPELICTPYLQGNEPVKISGAVPEGVLTFNLPDIAIGIAVHPNHGSPQRRIANLDTVIIRPDERKLNLVWRTTIECPRKIFDIERVVAFSLRRETALKYVN